MLTYLAISHILFEKPHSLSYHAEIFPILSPITFVKDASIIADASLWLKSIETSLSLVILRICLSLFLEADETAYTIGNNNLYLTNTDGNLIVVNLNDGNVLKIEKVARDLISKPIIYNENLFIVKNGSITQYD